MSNGIPVNNLPLNRYQQVTRPATVQRQAPPDAAAEARSVTPMRGAIDLSPAEQQMIDRYFPPSERMDLRLYGPGQKTRNVNPGAVGSRLDLRG